jgi:hypothetical protein
VIGGELVVNSDKAEVIGEKIVVIGDEEALIDL